MKFRMPTAYTILFILLILVALATWVVPAGEYERGEDGAPIAGTYRAVEQRPQGLGELATAPLEGFYDAVDVAVFILMVGGFLGITMKTGAIDAGIGRLITRLRGRERLLIPILMILFGLGGTTFGMWEETLAFYPLLLPVFVAAGYDVLTGIAVILLGAGAGVMAGTVNPFGAGVASGFAGVSLAEGMVLRILLLVIYEAVAIYYVMRYGERVRKNPHASLWRTDRMERGEEGSPPLTPKRKVALALFAGVFLLMVYSVIPFADLGLPLPALGWWFPELGALFLFGGVLVGLVYGLGEEETADAFVSGAGELLGVAFIIGISRGITVLMNSGAITDTILYWGEKALENTSSFTFILLIFLLFLPLSVLIPSSSGLATLSIPILAPLAVFAGIQESLVITAFQAASGLVNIITPTAAVVMGALAVGKVPYAVWIRFVWKLLLIFFLITCAGLGISALF